MTLDTSPKSVASGAQRLRIGEADVRRLEQIARLSGISDVTLKNRLSVVFVYPGMGIGNVYPDLAAWM